MIAMKNCLKWSNSSISIYQVTFRPGSYWSKWKDNRQFENKTSPPNVPKINARSNVVVKAKRLASHLLFIKSQIGIINCAG